jgi:prepilin-type processing-associated H-X9-DG protein
MNTINRPGSGRRPELVHSGFTIIELLVIIAIVAVLILLQLPVLARVSAQSRAAQCSSNLKQFALVVHIYGHEYREQLPPVGGGFWAWDLPVSAIDPLTRYGASRDIFYCPANPDQNADGLWNFFFTYRILGYVTTFPSVASLTATNMNASLVPQQIVTGPGASPPPPASKRVLLADVTMSQAGQGLPIQPAWTFTSIPGGYTAPGWPGHRTSHLNNRLPSGGNVAMLDGHVEWRPFANMVPRTDVNNGTPVFWW